ncbi:hypothetical protein [Clostridium tyrobutyricum]|uniref:hypothetical protein n=1 Tax=Clostridium tyrobutyricum TaxID=1519 RepID=UPI00057D1C0B|nr:hypothetical protein [Clostridium tyrobutyricum]
MIYFILIGEIIIDLIIQEYLLLFFSLFSITVIVIVVISNKKSDINKVLGIIWSFISYDA